MTQNNSGISIKNLIKTFQKGTVVACRDVNLEIAEGEFMVLLGPSGCGKTTTLRCIAGLEQPDNDDAIWIKGKNITRLAPKDRNLSFIFQDIILFPHLNVRRNISFGLDMRKSFDKAEINRRVQAAAELVQLEELLDRKSNELSGGQAQRVALARAIVMEADAFLMDEPLANLDAKLRVEMRTEIKRIQRKLSTAAIFVTHDQEEALTLGDTITVMDAGEVQQVGSPYEIYHDPTNLFVGTFIGSPPLNVYTCSLQTEDSKTVVKTNLFKLPLPDGVIQKAAQNPENLTVGIRPEYVMVGDEQEGSIPAQVTLIEPLGSRTLIFLESNGFEIQAVKQGEATVNEGENVHVTFIMNRAYLFDQDGDRM